MTYLATMYKLDNEVVTYSKFYDNVRELTPSQVVEAANDAVENWEWEFDDRMENGDLARSFLENWDEEFVITTFADDDGIVRLSSTFKDIWDWLDEFVISSYASYLADKEHWGT